MNKIRGFTLFELLVSISIIGILTALGVLSFSSAQTKARDARRVEDMNTIQKAVEQLYASAGSTYPVTNGPWPGYLENWPVDPKNSAPNIYEFNFTVNTGYCACAVMENINKANAVAGCDFVTNPKTRYCVKNQQ
jgi:prepilin-type N-terminal cleavage/methylation domain-containing protein